VLAVLTVTLVSESVLAQPAGPGGRRGAQMGPRQATRPRWGSETAPRIPVILRLKDKLGLTTKQVEKLKVLRDTTQKQHKTTFEAVKVKRQALQKAVESQANEAAIRAAAGQLGNALGDQAVLKVTTKAKVDAILTDEQKSQLKTLKPPSGPHKGKTPATAGKPGRRAVPARDPEAIFSRIDTNGDGNISLEEFKAHSQQARQRIGRRGQNRRPKGPNK